MHNPSSIIYNTPIKANSCILHKWQAITGDIERLDGDSRIYRKAMMRTKKKGYHLGVMIVISQGMRLPRARCDCSSSPLDVPALSVTQMAESRVS